MVLPEPPFLPADVLGAFVRRRKKLNECLDETRVAIDTWLERQPMPPPLAALASLEVLLTERRDCLAELIALDDELMLLLIRLLDCNPEGHD